MLRYVIQLVALYSAHSSSLHLFIAVHYTGKVHGSLARAGNVKGQTPKVEKTEKKKSPRGRAHKKILYNRRFVNVVVGAGKKIGYNSLAAQNMAKGLPAPTS